MNLPTPGVSAPVKKLRVDAKNAPSCGTTVEAPLPNPALGNTDKLPPFSDPDIKGHGPSRPQLHPRLDESPQPKRTMRHSRKEKSRSLPQPAPRLQSEIPLLQARSASRFG